MNKEEFIGKLQLLYVGDKRASEEIISEYDRLNNIINELESYLEQQWLEWKDDCDDGIVAMANEDKTVLDKLKALKENK